MSTTCTSSLRPAAGVAQESVGSKNENTSVLPWCHSLYQGAWQTGGRVTSVKYFHMRECAGFLNIANNAYAEFVVCGIVSCLTHHNE